VVRSLLCYLRLLMDSVFRAVRPAKCTVLMVLN